MKQKKIVSMIGVLILLISAVVLITGCQQASKPTSTQEAGIEGVPWKCIYATNSSWDNTVLTLNGTTAIFKDPDKDAFSISCVIDKANRKIKLVFSDGTDEFDYAIKENGNILEFSRDGVLRFKFRRM